MAQETQGDWDAIMKELERVKNIRPRVISVSKKVQKLSKDVQLIKKVDNIDQKSQDKLDKDENVISDESKSLKAVLTQNQKRRYQNIGKQFVKGAGVQFDKIKKAIKFKEEMDTKKQNFDQKIKTVQQQQKKSVKHGGFWKKMLGIVAVLGIAAYIFRDKIAKLIPDLSGATDNIGLKVFSYFNNLLGFLLKFSTNVIGGLFSGVVMYACRNLFPNLVGTFFRHSLPIALVASTLAVMSMFSQSAGQQLNQVLNNRAFNRTEQLSDAAEAQVQTGDYLAQLIENYKKENIEKIEEREQLHDMLKNFANMMYATQGLQTNPEMESLMTVLKTLTGSNEDLFLTRQIDLGAILHNINGRLQAGQTVDKEFIARLIKSQLDVIGVNLSDAQINTLAGAINPQYFKNLTQQMIQDDRYKAIHNKLNAEVSVNQQVPATQTQTAPPTTTGIVTNLHIGQVLAGGFADKIQPILQSIDNFLNGNDTRITISSAITDYFKNLGELSKNYIAKNLWNLGGILEQIIKENKEPVRPITTPTGQVQPVQISNSSILMINIDVNDTYTNALGNTISEMTGYTQGIISEVQKGNTKLGELSKQLEKSIIVIDKGGTRANSQVQENTNQQLLGMIGSLQRELNELKATMNERLPNNTPPPPGVIDNK